MASFPGPETNRCRSSLYLFSAWWRRADNYPLNYVQFNLDHISLFCFWNVMCDSINSFSGRAISHLLPVPYPLQQLVCQRRKWDCPDWFLLEKSMLSVPNHIITLKVFKNWLFINLFYYLSSYWNWRTAFHSFPIAFSICKDRYCVWSLVSKFFILSKFSMNFSWFIAYCAVATTRPGQPENIWLTNIIWLFFPLVIQSLYSYVDFFYPFVPVIHYFEGGV